MFDKFYSRVKEDDIKSAETFLCDHSLDVNQMDNSGKSALYYAISNSSREMVTLLLDRGMNVNHLNYVAYHRDNHLCSCYEPPIITCTRVGDIDILELLIAAGANIDLQCEIRKRDCEVYRDRTALHFACEDHRVDMVDVLLRENADVNIEDKSGEIALHKVVRCRDCEKQSAILQKLCEHGADVNHTSKIECNPLYLATFYGCSRKAQILLLYGADCNKYCMRENGYGTPLHVVSAKDRTDLAEMLIEHGADLSMTNSLQCTPLQLNINMLSKSDVAQLLVYHGVAVNGVDKWNLTVMASCIRNMRLDCEKLARLLVFAGYDLKQDVWLKPRHLRSEADSSDIPDVPIAEGRVRRLCDWLWQRQCNPSHLVDLCRICIRQVLTKSCGNKSVVPHIMCLPLPGPLKSFLLLKELMK